VSREAELPPAAAAAPESVELLVEQRGEGVALLAPGVGLFTRARGEGELLAAGADAGTLLVLGRALRLVAPPGVEGRITTPRAAPTHRPVAFGELLYELRPIAAAVAAPADGEAGGADPTASETRAGGGGLLVRSPRSGRFFLRPAPTEEPFVAPGAIVEEGQPIGLIEVMKTFAHVPYTAAGGLPPRARVERVLVQDGAEIAVGDPLLVVALLAGD
jgi:biotin carboxyl carrier protein